MASTPRQVLEALVHLGAIRESQLLHLCTESLHMRIPSDSSARRHNAFTACEFEIYLILYGYLRPPRAWGPPPFPGARLLRLDVAPVAPVAG